MLHKTPTSIKQIDIGSMPITRFQGFQAQPTENTGRKLLWKLRMRRAFSASGIRRRPGGPGPSFSTSTDPAIGLV
jgi:hypothetical protein